MNRDLDYREGKKRDEEDRVAFSQGMKTSISELDKRLESVLRDVAAQPLKVNAVIPEALAQIHKAFEEAGYRNWQQILAENPTYSTGQEFYSAFERELEKEDWPSLPFSNKKVLTYKDVMRCAQVASGLIEGKPRSKA